MKKFNFTTFELLKYLIENNYLKGVEGCFRYAESPPSPYGDKITEEIAEFCGKHLEPWGNPDFLDEAYGLIPIPGSIDTTFNVVRGLINMNTTYTFDEEDYPPEGNLSQDISSFIDENLEPSEIIGENLYIDYTFINGATESFSASVDIDDIETAIDEKYFPDIIEIIHDVLFDNLLSELYKSSIHLKIEYESVSFKVIDARVWKHKEGDFDDKKYEVIVDEEGQLSFSEL